MDTIQDTPEETFDAERPRFWKPKWRPEARFKASVPARGRPYRYEANWSMVALVSAGVAAGVLVGAGIALLAAPQSGAHTRLALSRGLRRRRPWRHGPWEQLGEELTRAARRKHKRVSSSWAAADL